MDSSSVVNCIVREVREVVFYPEGLLPRGNCYVLLENGLWAELQEQSPYATKLQLRDCEKSGWFEDSFVSPVAAWCSDKRIKDIVKSELFPSIGLLLEGSGQKLVLYLGGCSIEGQRAEILGLNTGYFEVGDLFSWIDGRPISLN